MAEKRDDSGLIKDQPRDSSSDDIQPPPEPENTDSRGSEIVIAPLELPPQETHSPTFATRGRISIAPNRLVFTFAVLLISGFLFFRIFFVEPFGVPTGSMAPALIGNHRETFCSRCGFPVRVGSSGANERASHFMDVLCPNCGKLLDLSESREVSGDRLLVDKNIYRLRSPRRWEVAVFRCPSDLSKPYVKRVVGLSGETLAIEDGDVYRIPDPLHPQDREMLRKSLAEIREIQVHVFDMNYSPPGGWGPRWVVYPADQDARLPHHKQRELMTAGDSILHGNELVLDASGTAHKEIRLEYRNFFLDENEEQSIKSSTSYDGASRGASNIYPVHDFYLRCEIEATNPTPEATFACRLFDGADAIAADLTVGEQATGRAHVSHETQGNLASAAGVAIVPGRTYLLEFAFVDRRATLALDGREVLAPVDLPAVKNRGEVKRPLQMGARGCKVVVRNLTIERDVYYTQSGRHGTRVPVQLARGEYFMLGDNSGNSQDSREWDIPGVPEANFIGKPILIHQPLRLRRVVVGGRERYFQALDWSRFRWLH